jgi:predicted enzyme related to lactoylglutathione lyase
VALRIETVAFDAHDPEAQGRWWAELLGWSFRIDEDGDAIVEPDDPSAGTTLAFFDVPDAKAVKNRVHLDLRPDDQDAEVARAEAMGATRVDVGQHADPDTTWVVLADPEGNEFCILRARPPA